MLPKGPRENVFSVVRLGWVGAVELLIALSSRFFRLRGGIRLGTAAVVDSFNDLSRGVHPVLLANRTCRFKDLGPPSEVIKEVGAQTENKAQDQEGHLLDHDAQVQDRPSRKSHSSITIGRVIAICLLRSATTKLASERI